jgi:allantoin racemase
MRLVLINPNTNAVTTTLMVGIARESAPPDVRIDGLTVRQGVPLITNPDMLRKAAWAVTDTLAATDIAGAAGVIVAAFGDPGLMQARASCRCPVTGIAEAGMAEAVQGGRRFAVVTTTPELSGSIASTAATYGHAPHFAGVVLTEGDPAQLMADPGRLTEALHAACRRAIDERGAEAIVIGGGPLARAARTLAALLSCPVIEPVPAAVRLAIRRAGEARTAVA